MTPIDFGVTRLKVKVTVTLCRKLKAYRHILKSVPTWLVVLHHQLLCIVCDKATLGGIHVLQTSLVLEVLGKDLSRAKLLHALRDFNITWHNEGTYFVKVFHLVCNITIT